MSKRIGFVGVGRMGANMALRLKECGYNISAVFDTNPEAAATASKALNALHCQRLDEMTANSDVIITVVTDDASMNQLFKPTGNSLLKNAKGRIFINCATVSPATHVKVEERAKKAGAKSLETCMASSITQAREGTLYLMCGGEKRTYQRVKPLLDKLSSSMRYVGTAGKAAEVKALVNMVMNINTAGLAEGLGLGEALGLDLDMLREVFSQTGANSRVLETDGEDMQKRDHDCYFSAAHAAKDSGIALSLGRFAKLKLPLAEATLGQYSKMESIGLGHLDKSGVAELTFQGRGPAKAKKAKKTSPKKAVKKVAKPKR
ncbi:MAG: NAD(P)-dependent oxidoreductase [Verrucomicrobia bacterium]|jgi:3-hydroxyisobutyrate dehydrogenase|nr:NAD(P)-dependent oxidoreductase [Verrucomicrobiota bacterium]